MKNTHEPNHVLSMEEIKGHGYRYHEHRIQNTQTIDLMLMYMKEFNELINKFHEKASSDVSLATESDNAE